MVLFLKILLTRKSNRPTLNNKKSFKNRRSIINAKISENKFNDYCNKFENFFNKIMKASIFHYEYDNNNLNMTNLNNFVKINNIANQLNIKIITLVNLNF